MATSYRAGQVAEVLQVSVDTVRRWCDDGTLATTRTPGGHRVVSGAELARHLRSRPHPPQPSWLPAQSARNRLTGVVTRVERDGVSAVVEIQVGGHRIVSLMTRDGADELGLEPGDLAVAAVKATMVVVEAAPRVPADTEGDR
ncbi:MAG: molybdopterin-binding protein [Kineosporiaceae bacterium]